MKSINNKEAAAMTLKDINWNQVYYFYEVARRLSMKEAALATGVSLPTVSEQIKRLESSLAVILFKRFPRRLELTSEGETLYQYAKEMFDSGVRFVDAISNTSSSYSARIGIQESAAHQVEVGFLRMYLDLFSSEGTIHTVKEVSCEKMMDRLIKGEFDWALTLEPTQSFRLSSEPIGKCEIVFSCAQNLAIEFETQAEILRLLPLARTSWDYRLNETVEDHLSSQNITPMEILEIDHPELCLSMVEKGRCVTTMLKSDTHRYPHLRHFSLNKPIELTWYAVWKKSNERMTSVKALTTLLQGQHTANSGMPVMRSAQHGPLMAAKS